MRRFIDRAGSTVTGGSDHQHAASAGDLSGSADSGPSHDPLGFTKASVARVYDYVLGGRDNFDVDRRAAQSFLDVIPESWQIARDNRNFLRRGVRYLIGDAGIRQIIDIGSGLPTAGNVHEIAHEINPDVRVVYVDNDPIVLSHSIALLPDSDLIGVINGDVRDPDAILDHPTTREVIDLDQPFAVLIAGLLHHISDEDDPVGITARIRGRLPSGGYLLTANFLDPGEARARELEHAFLNGGLGHGRFRTRDEQTPYFTGLDLVEPGLVYANEWHPDPDTPTASAVHTLYLGGIGRKP